MDTVEIDADTADLLKSIDFGEIGGVAVQQHQHSGSFVKRQGGDRKPFKGDRKAGDRKPRPQKTEAAAAPAAAVPAQ